MVLNDSIAGARLNGKKATAGIKFNGEPVLEFVPPLPSVPEQAKQLAGFAKEWVGVTPYVPAGTNLQSGCNAGGFVHAVYIVFGYDIPVSTTTIASSVGTRVSTPGEGDIVIWGTRKEYAGIYTASNQIAACLPEGSLCQYVSFTAVSATAIIKRVITS